MLDNSSNSALNLSDSSGRMNERIEFLSNLIEEYPMNSELVYEKIQELIDLECFDVALELALKRQVLQPNTSFVASLIGFIYCKSANFLAASESLKKAISLNAADEVALYNLAILSKITSIAFDFSIDPLTNKQLSTHFFNQTALDQINQMSFLSPILVIVEQKKLANS